MDDSGKDRRPPPGDLTEAGQQRALSHRNRRPPGGRALQETVEVYGGDRSEAELSHGVCPECTPRLRQQLHLEE